MQHHRRLSKMTIWGISAVALLINVSGSVMAHTHVGHIFDGLPVIGDTKQASALIDAGDAATAAGQLQVALQDYRKANSLCIGYGDAELAVARGEAAVGDYDDAVAEYHKIIHDQHMTILGDTRGYGDVTLMTEYALVLCQAGDGPEAVKTYNSVVDELANGGSIQKWDVMPPKFAPDGSNYNPVRLQAMIYLLRALNYNTEGHSQALSEVQKALALDPSSNLLYFYKGILLSEGGGTAQAAQQVWKKAIALSHGDTVQVAARRALEKVKKPI